MDIYSNTSVVDNVLHRLTQQVYNVANNLYFFVIWNNFKFTEKCKDNTEFSYTSYLVFSNASIVYDHSTFVNINKQILIFSFNGQKLYISYSSYLVLKGQDAQ